MWSLDSCRHVFIAIGFIGVLVFCIPAIMAFVRVPTGEKFSELYILGPEHLADDYPFDVQANVSYLVYLGVVNHMGNSMYYSVDVKLRNASDPSPNATAGVATSLPSLYTYHVLLNDGRTWEGALRFSFSDVALGENTSSIGKMSLNDALVQVDKSSLWDNEYSGLFYQLIVELWTYNAGIDGFNFHNRYVTRWLNLTKSS